MINETEKRPVRLYGVYLLYFCFYMSNAVYVPFVPVYFESIGFSNTQIGILLSLGPIVALLAQPVWGTVSDRARTKNGALLLMLAGCAVSMAVFPLSAGFVFVMVMICLFMFFQTPVFAVGDAITLEILDRRGGGNFSHVRMAGTIGFAVMAVAFGWVAREGRVDWMFPVNTAVYLACMLLVARIPRVAGHQYGGRKMHMGMLFRYRRLMLYLALCFVLHVTLGYYYAFFPLYFQELGADSAWIGWSMLISALSEVPFLLWAARVYNRVPIPWILLGAGAVTAVRWMLYSIVENPLWVFPIQAMHGLILVVLTVTMAIFINREVPPELKASGQTLHALLCLGIARVIGSFLGGVAGDAYGLKKVFFYNGLAAAVCVAVFAVIFLRGADGREGRAAGGG